MPSRSLLNLTARAEERQFHQKSLVIFARLLCDLFVAACYSTKFLDCRIFPCEEENSFAPDRTRLVGPA